MPIENPQQLHERNRWSGLAGLVPGERIDAAAEDLGGLALVEGDIRLHSL
jgi:hypothetical protein